MQTTIESSNKINILRNKINFISCVLMCMWFTLPYFRIRAGVLLLLLLFGIWIITTDIKWLTKKWSLDLIFVLIFFITFIPYIITDNIQYGSAGPKIVLVHFPLFFIGIFINHYYMYYKKDYESLSKIAFITLLFFIIGSIQTYIGLSLNPMASRILATGFSEYETDKLLFNRMGVGGFGYIYSSGFLFISLLYLVLSKNTIRKMKRTIVFITIVSILIMIFEASFAIALMIILSGTILVLIIKNKKNLIMLMIICGFLLLLVPPTFIGSIFLDISNLLGDNYIIREKFTDLGMLFLHDAIGNQASKRIELYLMSFSSFLKQPIFGIYGPFGNVGSKIGGHSGWLDLLGYYGIFSGFPLFFILYNNFKKHLKVYKRDKYYGYLVVIYFLFLIIGTINPILHAYEVGFILFMIIPIIPMLAYDLKV